MTRWEYMTVLGWTDEHLNYEGKHGWELVCVYNNHAIFKRPNGTAVAERRRRPVPLEVARRRVTERV